MVTWPRSVFTPRGGVTASTPLSSVSFTAALAGDRPLTRVRLSCRCPGTGWAGEVQVRYTSTRAPLTNPVCVSYSTSPLAESNAVSMALATDVALGSPGGAGRPARPGPG